MDNYPLVKAFLSELPKYELTTMGATRILLATMTPNELVDVTNNCNLLLLSQRIQEESTTKVLRQPNIVRVKHQQVTPVKTISRPRNNHSFTNLDTRFRIIVSPKVPVPGEVNRRRKRRDERFGNLPQDFQRRESRQERFKSRTVCPCRKDLYNGCSHDHYSIDTPLPQTTHLKKRRLTEQQKAQLDKELEEYMKQDVREYDNNNF